MSDTSLQSVLTNDDIIGIVDENWMFDTLTDDGRVFSISDVVIFFVDFEFPREFDLLVNEDEDALILEFDEVAEKIWDEAGLDNIPR